MNTTLRLWLKDSRTRMAIGLSTITLWFALAYVVSILWEDRAGKLVLFTPLIIGLASLIAYVVIDVVILGPVNAWRDAKTGKKPKRKTEPYGGF